MGRSLVLTGTTLTDLTAPKLPSVDPIETLGSLALIEPGHPADPWVGVPAHNAAVPNLLWEKAKEVIPTGTEATLKGTSIVGAGFDLANIGVRERSAGGGYHLAQTQASVGDATRVTRIELPTLVRDYMVANPAHSYYASLQGRFTRGQNSAAKAGAIALSLLAKNANLNEYWAMFAANVTAIYPSSGGLGRRTTGTVGAVPGPTGPFSYSIGVSALSGTTPGSSASALAFWLGNPASIAGSADYGEGPSVVFYRFYVEDLTVSGRTYAEVDTIEAELYTRNVVTPGGRYYNDTTPTNPTALTG